MENYKNGWLLHNPISIEQNISDIKKKALDSVCYMGKENGNYIDFVFKNKNEHKNLKDNLGTNTILLFWGMGCYHIFKCDKETSYLYDKYKYQ